MFLNLNRVNQHIILNCPNCQSSYLIEDLDKFLDYKRLLWRTIFILVENGYEKQRVIGSLAVCSAKETLVKEMKENGALVATCLSCMTDMFKKIYLYKKIHGLSQIRLTGSHSNLRRGQGLLHGNTI